MVITELNVITFDSPDGQAIVTVKRYEHDRGPVSSRTERLTQRQLDDLEGWMETLGD